jgi:hypothetical protein
VESLEDAESDAIHASVFVAYPITHVIVYSLSLGQERGHPTYH